MSGVGQTLKEAREARGLTLYDVEDKTKIQTRYLKAIEEERFNVLPGHFYTRAFIRTYAEFLGLDPKPLLAHVKDIQEDDIEPVQVPEFQPLSRRAARQDEEPSFSLSKWFSRGLLILFLLLVVAVIWTAVNSASLGINGELPQEASKDTTPAGQKGDKQKAPPQQEKEEMGEPELTVTKTGEEGDTFYYEVSGADTVDIQLKANDRVWFEAREGDEDGGVLASKEIDAGTTETFTSKEGIYIRIGNTLGVDLEVNGEKVPTDYAQPKNYIFQLKTTE